MQVVLPLALPKPYTYFVPEELVDKIQFGVRVEVQFGQNRLYTAIVVKILDEQPEGLKPKAILSVVDSTQRLSRPPRGRSFYRLPNSSLRFSSNRFYIVPICSYIPTSKTEKRKMELSRSLTLCK